MQALKYRPFDLGLRNQKRTKKEMPGWGGLPQPRKDGCHEQPLLSTNSSNNLTAIHPFFDGVFSSTVPNTGSKISDFELVGCWPQLVLPSPRIK